ncbi:head-tail connector protein [Magnetospirillum aberrantis]|uniref:Phage gp6-like head-tail connector protein n=1 Tax=Magnetospirillum aberrantis SpK TaxID=908842 RepID=A0A7C9QTV6_9PROT|nr:head-tail connector protein [Magnetospirillum aberrantis]NFV80001.1 phage gp6-like head-tail connector protein [Magnetospirillum aberrantis SpK]
MSLILITAPAVEPISLDEAKAHLRVTGTDDDALIGGFIAAARQNLDGRDGWLGRALMPQTWELRLDAFPAEITVPLPPLREIVSVKYIDLDGAEQTLDPALYQVVAGEPARIVPAHGQVWPSTRRQPDAVRVQFDAGYDDAAAVPAPIKAATLLHVGTLYRDRETVNIGNIVNDLPTFSLLLSPFRVWSFA